MTDSQAMALLYSGGKVETDGFVVSSRFDDSTSEKNIEIFNQGNREDFMLHSKLNVSR